jgi:hypothetical protein
MYHIEAPRADGGWDYVYGGRADSLAVKAWIWDKQKLGHVRFAKPRALSAYCTALHDKPPLLCVVAIVDMHELNEGQRLLFWEDER